MGKNKLRGKDLKKIGYHSNRAKGIAIELIAQHYKHSSRDEKLKILTDIKADPDEYIEDPVLGIIAEQFTK